MAAKKSKEKSLFIIPWTEKHKTVVSKFSLRRFSLIVIGVFIFLSVGFGSSALPYAFSTVKCLGLPVETSDFMASRTVRAPGDDGYGLKAFSNYQYCTREEAEDAGYRPSILSEESKRAAAAQQKAREEEKKFSTSKVNYVVYTPNLDGYEISNLRVSDIKGNIHTFMRVKENGTVIGQIRELRTDDSYNICNQSDDPNKDYCTVIGKDSNGREIKRAFHNGFKGWTSNYAGIDIDGTGIILSSDDDTEAVKILSSLQKYTEE